MYIPVVLLDLSSCNIFLIFFFILSLLVLPIMTQISLKLLRGQEDLLAWIIASLCLISFTSGFSHGASQSACADMKPKHISAHSQDKRNSFITVHINKSTFLPGDQVPGKDFQFILACCSRTHKVLN